MSFFMLAYHGGKKPKKPEDCEDIMAQWENWIEDLGDALTDSGKPLGKSKTLSSSGVANDGGSNPLSGFSILEADNIDSAIEMIKDNPHIKFGGTIEIAELMDECA